MPRELRGYNWTELVWFGVAMNKSLLEILACVLLGMPRFGGSIPPECGFEAQSLLRKKFSCTAADSMSDRVQRFCAVGPSIRNRIAAETLAEEVLDQSGLRLGIEG